MVCGVCSGDGVLKPAVFPLTEEMELVLFAADPELNVLPRGEEEVEDRLACGI
jgi:hypothetical protein